MEKILVTDSLFIDATDVARLEAAGYEVERLDKPHATDAELAAAIKGKVGYILGGMEHVDRPVLESADKLRAITFTGIDVKAAVPGWQYAESRGIAVTNTPNGPTDAVAEWAVGAALLMNRHFLELGRTGTADFITSSGLRGQRIGLVGFGRIGRAITWLLEPFGVARVSYFSPSRHPDTEIEGKLEFAELSDVMATSDIVFLGVSSDAGENYIGAELLGQMKPGALLVSFLHPGVLDADALYEQLSRGHIRAISDYGMDDRFKDLPLSSWFCFNGSNAFNTTAAVRHTSALAVTTLLAALKSPKSSQESIS